MLEMLAFVLSKFLNTKFSSSFLIMKLKSDLILDQVFTNVPWMKTPTYKYLHIHAARGEPSGFSFTVSLFQ